MNSTRKYRWRPGAATALVLGLMLALLVGLSPIGIAQADTLNSGVFDSDSTPFGLTYGEWSAKWWQWAVAEPAANGPFTDTNGENCDVDQAGSVWFLAGSTGGAVTRNCTIPKKKAVLLGIINAEWSAAEANNGPYAGGTCFVPASPQGTSEEALRACATAMMERVTVVEATVDGVKLRHLNPRNSPYRVQSPLFTLTAAAGNAFGIPPGSTNAVADGFWLLLEPLSKGQHTIHTRGVAEFPEYGFTFETEATYNLTIK